MNEEAKIKSPLSHYRLLSPTAGVRVSGICLGAMSFGTKWGPMLGECDKETSFEILNHYYDMGGNFIDTANGYQGGQSEEWLGDWMKERNNREQIVLATKYTSTYPGLNGDMEIKANVQGNHAKSMVASLEASLKKLQTSYVDILYLHWWDHSSSVVEVMQALNRLVNAGKVLYLGVSDTPAWIVAKANEYAKHHGMAQFVLYQGQYSAAQRDMEREIFPMCEDQGMALAPWGAAGGGNFKTQAQREAMGDEGRKGPHPHNKEKFEKVTNVLDKIAKQKDSKLTNVAIAWSMRRAPYVFPIIGCRKLQYLKDAIESLTLDLSDEEVDEIDRASNFDVGFPLNMLFAQFNPDVNVIPSMTTQDMKMVRRAAIIDSVKKPRPIAPHKKEEYSSAGWHA